MFLSSTSPVDILTMTTGHSQFKPVWHQLYSSVWHPLFVHEVNHAGNLLFNKFASYVH